MYVLLSLIIYIYIYYNKFILVGKISNPYKIQGTRIINATTIGNKTVQQKDINWSNRILGKLALAQIKINIITQVLNPSIILENKPVERLAKI